MLTDISYNEACALIGAGLALLAFRYARGPLSIWMARLPGTLAHELAHYLLAALFRSNPKPPSLKLRRSEGGWILGSVEFQPRALTAGVVAIAPLLLLPPLAGLIWVLAQDANGIYALLSGYVATTVLHGAVPSGADWRIALRYPFGTLIALLALAFEISAFLGDKS